MKRIVLCMILVLLLTGCVTARANRGVGKLAVAAAMKTGEVNKLDLELAKPYLVYVHDLLIAKPGEVSVVLADVIAAELERWGEHLEADERLAVEAVVDMIIAEMALPPPTDEERLTAERAAYIIEGMIAGIDRLLE